MSRKIIIQGDDWGYKPEACRGIEYAYEHGILTETTIMPNVLDLKKKKEYKDRIESLENKTSLAKPKLGIGVHLNITFGKPLLPSWPKEKFTRPHKGSGKPEEWQGSAWREYLSQFTTKQVEDEYRRQIEVVLDIFGEIDHLDSHQNTSSYEPVISIFEKLAKEYDIPVRPIAPLSEKPVYGGDFVVDEEANDKLRKNGVRMADRNIFKLFFNEKDPIKSFLNEMDKVKDGETVEVMFHPAKGKGAEDWRKKDLDTLTNDKVLQYFKDNDIELITYREL